MSICTPSRNWSCGRKPPRKDGRLFIDAPELHDRRIAPSLESMGKPALARGGRALSPADERSLFLRYNLARMNAVIAGDGSRDPWDAMALATRGWLIEFNMPLVKHFITRFVRGRSTEDEAEDIECELVFPLLKAIDGFDVCKGFKFSTYAMRSFFTCLWRIRAPRRPRGPKGASWSPPRVIPFSQMAGAAERPFDAPAIREERFDPGADAASMRRLDEALALCADVDPRAAEAIRLRLGLHIGSPLSLGEIAKAIGSSGEHVRKILAECFDAVSRGEEQDDAVDAIRRRRRFTRGRAGIP